MGHKCLKYHIIVFWVILSIMTCMGVLSQNLVLNPGFEDYENCPEIGSNDFNGFVRYWKYTTNEPVEYISEECGAGVPENNYVNQYPKNGHAYSAVFVHPGFNYLEGLLKKTLKKTACIMLVFIIHLLIKVVVQFEL